MHHEAAVNSRNSFLTLTYRDPPPEKIDKAELQNFFKRLRHEYRFKYFACGEYGGQTHRPHYHAVIFGEDFRAGKTISINSELYSNNRLEKIWGEGSVVCASVTMASCCYVAGYVNKKVGDPDTFRLMSRGIGKEWIKRYYNDVQRTGVVVVEGREYPVPPRYFSWMEEELADVKLDRKLKVKERENRLGMPRS